MKIKALVIMPLDESQKRHIAQFQNNIDFEICNDCKVSEEQISDAQIIIGNPPVNLLAYADKLKWLQLVTAGADMYLRDNLLDEKVIVTNASGAYGDAQSEIMLSLLLSMYKKLNHYRDNQLRHIWKDEGEEKMLSGSTALVLGMGNIGSEFAKKLKALGVYVIGVRRSGNKNTQYADEIYSFEELDKHISRADIISMSLPSSPQTVKLMNKEMISRIKTGSVLINVGRGNTLDTDALCEALENGKLSAAALDVFENEPLPPSHKLWNMKNVIITPHIAGRDFLPHTLDKTISIIMKNLEAYIKGNNLINIVDRNIYEFKL